MVGGTVSGPPSTPWQVRCLCVPVRKMYSGTAVTRPDHRGVVLGPHVKRPNPQGPERLGLPGGPDLLSLPGGGPVLPRVPVGAPSRHHGKPASYRDGASCHRAACVGKGRIVTSQRRTREQEIIMTCYRKATASTATV
jgi:hypothetical protein